MIQQGNMWQKLHIYSMSNYFYWSNEQIESEYIHNFIYKSSILCQIHIWEQITEES